MGRLIEKRALEPALAMMPWLAGNFGFDPQAEY